MPTIRANGLEIGYESIGSGPPLVMLHGASTSGRAGGLRSSAVISALSREGLTGWYNVSGGMTAWLKAGYAAARTSGRDRA